MDMTPPNIPSSGDGEMGRTIDMSGYPHAKKIRRARIAEDWYACAGAQGALVGWTRIVNPSLTIEIDTVVSDDDIYESTFVEQERIVLRDPLGTINNSLLAVEKDGLFYIPEGHEVYCYQPEDAVDGHYEPLNFGRNCEEGSGSVGSEDESISGEYYYFDSGSDSFSAPCMWADLVDPDDCWIGCVYDELRHKRPHSDLNYAECDRTILTEFWLTCGMYYDDGGHLMGWLQPGDPEGIEWFSPWDIPDPR